LHSVNNEGARTADPDAAEEYSSTFGLVSAAGDAEAAWSRLPLLLVQERLRVGSCAVVEVVDLEAGFDHVCWPVKLDDGD
jgi:hypothetical protein